MSIKSISIPVLSLLSKEGGVRNLSEFHQDYEFAGLILFGES